MIKLDVTSFLQEIEDEYNHLFEFEAKLKNTIGSHAQLKKRAARIELMSTTRLAKNYGFELRKLAMKRKITEQWAK